MRTAVVTVASGRHDHVRLQHEMLSCSSVSPDDHLVVAIDDPVLGAWATRTPRVTGIPFVGAGVGLPLAAARNAGAVAAVSRGAELLIFLDADCLPDVDLVHWYRAAARSDQGRRSLLCGPVAYLPPPPPSGYALDELRQHSGHRARPEPDPGDLRGGGEHRLFWSLSFAVTRSVWERIGGFHDGYHGYGAEDTDFAQLAKAAGVDLTWVGGAMAYHQWHPTSSPPVQHVDDILRNGALFADRWGWWPMEGWLAQFEELGLVRWDAGDQTYRRPSTGSGNGPSTGSGNGPSTGSGDVGVRR